MLRLGLDTYRRAPMREQPLVVPSAHLRRQEKPKRSLRSAALIGHAVLASSSHWLTALLAVDMVSYALSGRCLVFRPLVWPFGWLEAGVESVLGPVFGSICCALLLLFLAVPGSISLAVALTRLARLAAKEIGFLRCRLWRRRHGGEIDAGLFGFVFEMSLVHGLPCPDVVVSKPASMIVSSEASAFGISSRITMSERLAAKLSSSEMRALLTHEIGHLLGDAQRLQRLRWCSALCLWPAYYLTMFYSFAERELEADAFAARWVGSEAVARALSAAHVLGATSGDAWRDGGYRSKTQARLSDVPRMRGIAGFVLSHEI